MNDAERIIISPAYAKLQELAGMYKGGHEGTCITELAFTDTGERYQLHITPDTCEVVADPAAFRDTHLKAEMPLDTFNRIASHKLNPLMAFIARKIKVHGSIDELKALAELFGE